MVKREFRWWGLKWFPLKNGKLVVKLEDDKAVDDYNEAKSLVTMPSPFSSCIFSYSKGLMNDVITEIRAFYNISVYSTDTDSLDLHKKYWSSSDDNGFIVKSFGLCKNDYGTSGIFYAWFLAPRKKYS